jgi:hypothetical protein
LRLRLAVQAAALWPTPTTGDHATMYQQGGEALGHAARWPTPMQARFGRRRRGDHATMYQGGGEPLGHAAVADANGLRQKIEATTTAQPVCFWPCLARLAVRRFRIV